MRSPPEIPKARAISRLPALPEFSATKARIASRLGSSFSRFCFGLRAKSVLFRCRPRLRLALGRRLAGCRPARRRLASAALGRLLAKERDSLLQSEIFRRHAPRQGRVSLGVVHGGTEAAGSHSHGSA